MFSKYLSRGDEGTLNSLNVRVQKFMNIWHSNKPRSGTEYIVSRSSLKLRAIASHTKYALKIFNELSPINEVISEALKGIIQFYYYKRYTSYTH